MANQPNQLEFGSDEFVQKHQMSPVFRWCVCTVVVYVAVSKLHDYVEASFRLLSVTPSEVRQRGDKAICSSFCWRTAVLTETQEHEAHLDPRTPQSVTFHQSSR